mmetsp:Transcript_2855/g.11561  ORF Transcript_2855/g.11561 Transcript_2855/m.11561 type:complete len:381 (+) Transcript_2855:1106-2248(+)
MAEEGGLLPEESEEHGASHVLGHAAAPHREVDGRGEEADVPDGHADVEGALRLELVAAQQVLAHVAVLLDERADLVVDDLAHVKVGQQRAVHGGGVVVGEGVGNVAAREVGDGQPASGVQFDVLGQVVRVAFHAHPHVRAGVVLGHLGHGDVLAGRGHALLVEVDAVLKHGHALVLAPDLGRVLVHRVVRPRGSVHGAEVGLERGNEGDGRGAGGEAGHHGVLAESCERLLRNGNTRDRFEHAPDGVLVPRELEVPALGKRGNEVRRRRGHDQQVGHGRCEQGSRDEGESRVGQLKKGDCSHGHAGRQRGHGSARRLPGAGESPPALLGAGFQARAGARDSVECCYAPNCSSEAGRHAAGRRLQCAHGCGLHGPRRQRAL